MSEQTKSSLRITGSEAEVRSVIADLASYPTWTQGMSTPHVLESDSGGQPSRAQFEISAGPIRDIVELHYTWGDRSVEWELLSAKSMKALNGRYSWQQTGTEVEVQYELAIELVTNLPGLVRRMAEQAIVTSALQGLKRRVESHATSDES